MLFWIGVAAWVAAIALGGLFVAIDTGLIEMIDGRR